MTEPAALPSPAQQGAALDSGGVGAQLLGAAALCVPFWLLESVLSQLKPGTAPIGARAGAGAVMLGLWGLSAVVWTLAGRLVLGLTLGQRRHRAARAGLAQAVTRAISERGQPSDHARLATVIAAPLAVSAFLAGSVTLTAYLVEYRHGATLIALTAVGAQVGLLALCAGLGAGCWRVVHVILTWLAHRSVFRFLNVVTVTFALAIVGIGLLGYVGWRFREVIVATDAVAIALPALAAVLHWVLAGRFAGITSRVGWALPVVALGMIVAGSTSTVARQLVIQRSDFSKYVFGALTRAGDIDGDGATSFPFFADCAPLDPAVHGYALEIPGNGRDENCDGLDTAPDIFGAPWARHGKKLDPQPNLVLVTFDAMRADHVSFIDGERDTTPYLASLGKEGVVFLNAFSQDSGTGPSFWSLMAGKTPFQTKLSAPKRFPPTFHASELLLAEQLTGAGYYAEGVLCGSLFGKKDWHIDRGFKRFENVCGRRDSKVAPTVSKKAIAALERVRKQEPFFLWVHYLDPHHPYTNHKQYDYGARPIDNYDEEIRYADHHFKSFHRKLQALASERSTYLFVGADHGENFNEHGESQHARTLYREVTRVPLMVHGEGLVPRRLKAPVALGDLYPTLLELGGVDVPPTSTMHSLVPVLRGDPEPTSRYVFQENSYSRPRRHAKAVIAGRYHFILDTTNDVEELFDLERDPTESHNLIGQGIPEEAALRQALLTFIQTTHVPDDLAK